MSALAETVPFNLQQQDASDATIDAAVDYAISVATSYVEWVCGSAPQREPGVAPSITGADVLDLGPGPTLGAALVMACAGARVSVADRYLVPWDEAFHPAFVRRLLARLDYCRESYREPLRRVVRAGAFDGAVERIGCGAETVGDTGARFDYIFSNAVFEHVEDAARSARSLFAATRPGGLGFHQVDLRDHRNFDDPLRFLTLSSGEFAAIPGAVRGDYGSTRRASDYVACLADAGFTIRRATVSLRAGDDYLARMRNELHPEFRNRSEHDLSALDLFVCVERPL
jgi:SAM-dependent methyltransferase